ncbi:MAG: RNA polymerase factor sigma-32, partial [Shewanella sp.]
MTFQTQSMALTVPQGSSSLEAYIHSVTSISMLDA